MKAKFKVGDKVLLHGKHGEIAAVAAHDEHWLATCPQQYSVKVPAPKGSDHEFDTIGCVPEDELKHEHEHKHEHKHETGK